METVTLRRQSERKCCKRGDITLLIENTQKGVTRLAHQRVISRSNLSTKKHGMKGGASAPRIFFSLIVNGSELFKKGTEVHQPRQIPSSCLNTGDREKRTDPLKRGFPSKTGGSEIQRKGSRKKGESVYL